MNARPRNRKAEKVRKVQMIRVLLAAGVVTVAATAASESAAATVSWTGARVVAALQTRRLSLDGATIKGDIDFRSFDAVEHPFSCRNCAIEGRILADDVVFDATLDLSGAAISEPVLVRRATFHGPVLFGPTSGTSSRSSSFSREADFSFTRFDDLTTFVQASFAATADFTTARFRSASVFADATFERDAVFERAIFGGGTDFRGSTFDSSTTFAAAQFEDRADFSDATFAGRADFGDTRFRTDATFLGTLFTYGGGRTYGVTFGGAISERDLVFDLAQFSGGGIFRQTVAGRVLSFDGSDMASTRKRFVFDRASAKGITMDVGDALAVVAPGDRRRVLRLIEAGAKASGDLGVANDARFSLEVLKSRDEPWWHRIPNVVFYRVVAGYFVRPFHPIATLFVLAGFVALVRTGRTRGTSSSLVRRVWVKLSTFGRESLDALALIGRRADGNGPGGRRVEAFTYRILVICALIGLGNSNPTLREMFDALV
jgi:uncharacterized protein YjbI with pentapeptide repeats